MCAAILCFQAAAGHVYASSLVEEAAAAVQDSAETVYEMEEADVPELSDAPETAYAPEVPDSYEEAELPEIPGYEGEDEVSPDQPEILTGASDTTWTVGDNVTARISSGNLYFTSNNGQLYDDWKEIIGDAVLSVENVSLSGGKMYLPEDSSFLFENMTRLKNINTSGMDTSLVTDMAGMFADLTELTELDLSGFDTSGVIYMDQMFYGCNALSVLNLGGFSTSGVLDMEEMFCGCGSLARLDLSGFDTSKVSYMSSMFAGCGSLTELNLKNFDAANASTDSIFADCGKLAKLVTPKASGSSIQLPKTMYDASGKAYTSLPVLTSSITLTASKPSVTPTPAPKYAFSDVQNPKHAYFNAIYWAADAGITKGYADGTFGINRSCTRGEMMMFLWRYAGKQSPKTVSKSPFRDVPKTHVFYKAILWGSQKGITKGYADGTFGVNRNVSRGECMMFLWRLNGKPAPKTVSKSPFSDVPKNHVFYNAILWGAQKKITTGYTSGEKKGTFGINENCTRGQIVTFLYRAKK